MVLYSSPLPPVSWPCRILMDMLVTILPCPWGSASKISFRHQHKLQKGECCTPTVPGGPCIGAATFSYSWKWHFVGNIKILVSGITWDGSRTCLCMMTRIQNWSKFYFFQRTMTNYIPLIPQKTLNFSTVILLSRKHLWMENNYERH